MVEEFAVFRSPFTQKTESNLWPPNCRLRPPSFRQFLGGGEITTLSCIPGKKGENISEQYLFVVLCKVLSLNSSSSSSNGFYASNDDAETDLRGIIFQAEKIPFFSSSP